MFSQSDELDRAVKAVLEVAANLDRGDILELGGIEYATGCLRYEGRWNNIVLKVRKTVLRERGIAMRPITNVGYKFCLKDEQVKYCARSRQKRAIRQLNRGVREVGAVSPDGLPLHLQRLRALTLQGLIAERRSVKRGVREQQNEIKRTETLPKRPVS